MGLYTTLYFLYPQSYSVCRGLCLVLVGWAAHTLGGSLYHWRCEMLEVLERVELALPQLLASEEGWRTLLIDYHPPVVERVFRQWGDFRISLHCIHPCAPSEALFHPHPWPSAMRILSGTYEMAVGYGAGDEPPPHAAKIIARGDLAYEMTDPNAWHYVRPIGDVAMTLMVTGPPWQRSAPGPTSPLGPLTPARAEEIKSFFRERFDT